jgi:hypothetical protein
VEGLPGVEGFNVDGADGGVVAGVEEGADEVPADETAPATNDRFALGHG